MAKSSHGPWAKHKAIWDCPFCGHDERRIVKLRNAEGETVYAVQCTKCLARGPIVSQPVLADTMWSTREGQ